MRRRDFITIFGAAGILIGQAPVFAQTFRTYNCYDRSQFILAFFEGDKRAHLQLDGKTITLPKRMALSGSTLRERRHQFEDYKDGHHAQARKAIDRMCHSVMVIEQWSISASGKRRIQYRFRG